MLEEVDELLIVHDLNRTGGYGYGVHVPQVEDVIL
jgi:hypothetical protein